MYIKLLLKIFTEKELANIIEDYKNGMKPYKIGEKYNRNSSSIIHKLQDIGIYKNTHKRYSDEDIAFLRTNYPIGNYETIFQRFPQMTKKTLYQVCAKNKIKAENFFWTEEELIILRDNYYTKSLQELVILLNNRFTEDAIQTKALKYFNYSKDRSWTETENNILKKYYSIETLSKIMSRLPKRSRGSIINKAMEMKLKSYLTVKYDWTDEDKNFLIDNWQKMSDKQLAVQLNRKPQGILDKRLQLNLLRCKHYNQSSYENLSKYLRGQIWSWKKQSMINCNYRCVLSNSKDFNIHHLYSFSLILSETIEENNIKLKDKLKDYTEDELKFIINKFLEKHKAYPLGVCINKEIHKKFHQEYGNITVPEMWNDFMNKYRKEQYTKTTDK